MSKYLYELYTKDRELYSIGIIADSYIDALKRGREIFKDKKRKYDYIASLNFSYKLSEYTFL